MRTLIAAAKETIIVTGDSNLKLSRVFLAARSLKGLANYAKDPQRSAAKQQNVNRPCGELQDIEVTLLVISTNGGDCWLH